MHTSTARIPFLLVLGLAACGSAKDTLTDSTSPTPGTPAGTAVGTTASGTPAPGTTSTGTTVTTDDCDGDGYSDAVETALGSDPCDASSSPEDVTDLLLVVGRTGPIALDHTVPTPPVDVVFAFDTTGSMGSEIGELQADLVTGIMDPLRASLGDVGFGLADYQDFPVDSFGDAGNVPFRLDQRVTTDSAAIQAAVDGMAAFGGGDAAESGHEALFQIATGVGAASWSGGSIDAFDPAVGRVTGVADGPIGGAGIRTGALPVVIQITDAPSHDAVDYGAWVTGAHSRSQAVSALRGAGVAVVGLAGSGARTEARAMAADTDAVVPVCAFQGACGVDQCCTGQLGSAQAPISGACPLAFEIDDQGQGLSTAVTTAVQALVEHRGIELGTRVLRDEAELAASGVDTACFVESVAAVGTSGTLACSAPVAVDQDLDGTDDGFADATPGVAAHFEVRPAGPGCTTPTSEVQVFTASIEVLADQLHVVDTRTLTVAVEPASR